jgi:cytochrome c553
MSSSFATEIDLDLGEEINEVCAGCHGEYGEGGKQGEYPRLAGLPVKYISQQLKLFKEEKRKNMPMRPYANERELPDEDIPSIATFLSQIKLTSQMPIFDENTSAYDKLLIAKKVFNIPKQEGDIVLGKKIYKKECKSCHGREGKGKNASDIPPLAGQYTEYMLKQLKQIANSEREHDDDADFFAEMKADEIQAIMAYLSIMDD